MTPVATSACPHCGAGNTAGSTFCAACGKALPVASSGPRVLGKSDFATTAAGQKLQGDELVKLSKKASTALLVVAIIQTVAPFIFYMIAQNMRRGGASFDMLVIGIMFGIAALFWGLWAWSRFQPLPATIVGLVLYGTLVAINVVSATSHMTEKGGTGGGFGGIGIGVLDIVIIAVLAQGIQAGSKYRKLMQQQSGI
jgi:hypothetical protein